jgi:hypothetical protein
VLGSFIFLSTPIYAEQSGLCEDLSNFTCSPGKQEDGTGSAQKNSNEGNEASTEFDSKRDFAEKKIRALLNDPENTYFTKLGLGATGLKDAPQCVSKEAQDVKKCRDDLVEGLVGLAKKKLTKPSFRSPYVTNSTLEQKTLVLENSRFAKVLGEIEQEISGQFDYRAQEKLIKDDLFVRVKKQLVKKVSSLPIDEKKKEFMISKLKGISYGGINCEEMGSGLSKMFIANAYYNPKIETFKVCKGLLSKNISEFHLAFVIAHELAHSIDPCSIKIGPEGEALKYSKTTEVEKLDGEYPIQGLIGCLRTPMSVAALSQTPMGPYGSTLPPAPGGASGGYGSYGAPASDQQYDYCKVDQIGESMSDWFGAEVLTDLIEEKYPNLKKEQWQKGFSNVFRPMCNEELENSPYANFTSDPHPKTSNRVNALLLVNPKIRAKMGCEKPHSKKVYCDANNPALLAQLSQQAKNDLKANPATTVPFPGGGAGYPPPPPTRVNENQTQEGAR